MRYWERNEISYVFNTEVINVRHTAKLKLVSWTVKTKRMNWLLSKSYSSTHKQKMWSQQLNSEYSKHTPFCRTKLIRYIIANKVHKSSTVTPNVVAHYIRLITPSNNLFSFMNIILLAFAIPTSKLPVLLLDHFSLR